MNFLVLYFKGIFPLKQTQDITLVGFTHSFQIALKLGVFLELFELKSIQVHTSADADFLEVGENGMQGTGVFTSPTKTSQSKPCCHVAMCCISIHSLLTAVISWPLGRQTNQKSSCYYTHDLLNWEHQQQTKQNKLAETWEARNQ